jgi:hypothetical protein
MVDDINPFWFSAHGTKEDRYVNGRHVRLVKWSVIGHLRPRDVLCAAKDETSVEFIRPLLNSWAECSVVISC